MKYTLHQITSNKFRKIINLQIAKIVKILYKLNKFEKELFSMMQQEVNNVVQKKHKKNDSVSHASQVIKFFFSLIHKMSLIFISELNFEIKFFVSFLIKIYHLLIVNGENGHSGLDALVKIWKRQKPEEENEKKGGEEVNVMDLQQKPSHVIRTIVQVWKSKIF